MTNTTLALNLAIDNQTAYDVPELTFIGDATDVVMGMPGGGFDGAFSMTEPPFEFELDELD